VVEEVLRAVSPSKKTTRKKAEETVVRRLDYVIGLLRRRSRTSLTKLVKEMEFSDLKEMLLDVFDAIAFFDIPESKTNVGVFEFIELAIVERDRKEGAELFGELLTWFFQTVTPSCKDAILKLFAHLTRLSYLKEVVSATNSVSSFVAEFGSSHSYEIAGVNAEILKNIQFLFSETDCDRFVDFALSNDQISGSWKAKEYLRKILTSCEGKVSKEKMQELHKLLQ